MSIWIQHGYGKGDKIDRLVDTEELAGIVMSPADENRAGLADIVRRFRDDEIDFLLDPQLYVHTIEGAVGRCHEDHGLDFMDVQWSASASVVKKHVNAVLEANDAIGTETVLSPSPLQATFMDFWSPLSLQYARTALEVAGGRPVFASVVVDEEGLADWETIETWLDAATQLEVAGFYVVIARSDVPYPEAWDYKRLANYMRLVHRLHDAEYRVLAGYTDLEGLVLAAVGGEPATGWFYTQRRFTEGKWKKGGGGQPPIPRILSDRLLVPLQVPEVIPILRSQQARLITSDESTQKAVLSGDWSLGRSRTQFLLQMAELITAAISERSLDDRLRQLSAKTAAATQQLTQLGSLGLLVAAPAYLKVVGSLTRAIAEFTKLELS